MTANTVPPPYDPYEYYFSDASRELRCQLRCFLLTRIQFFRLMSKELIEENTFELYRRFIEHGTDCAIHPLPNLQSTQTKIIYGIGKEK